MPWYYVEDGQQAGPVSENEFEAMLASGRVSPETLVWQEGMENWKPYREVRQGSVALDKVGAGAYGGDLQAGGSGSYTPAPAAGLVQCQECGRYYGEDQVIRYGTSTVCASCKPGFVQRIKEGGRAQLGALDYAGFWIRVLARIIDGLVLAFIVYPILIGLHLATGGSMDFQSIVNRTQGSEWIFYVAGIIPFLYEALMISRYGATLGKMAVRIRVVRPDGDELDRAQPWWRAVWMHWIGAIPLVGVIIQLVGCIMVAFDEEKRGLHDRLLNTRVVRV